MNKPDNCLMQSGIKLKYINKKYKECIKWNNIEFGKNLNNSFKLKSS